MVNRESISRHCICCSREQLQPALIPFVAQPVFAREPIRYYC